SVRGRAPASAGVTWSSASAISDASSGRRRSSPEELKIDSRPWIAIRRSMTRRARSSLMKSSSVDRTIEPRAYGSPAANSLPKRSVVTALSSSHHDQDVARVHGLARPHADPGPPSRSPCPARVPPLHSPDAEQGAPGLPRAARGDGSAADLPGRRRGQRPASRPAGRSAARTDDVARLLLYHDLIRFAADVHHAHAVP